MTLLTADASAVVAIAAAGVAVVAVGLASAAQLRISRLRRSYAALLGNAEHDDLVGIVGQHVRSVETLSAQVDQARREVDHLALDLADAVRHVAVVRYDAFGDMGGRLSFSAAMLDDGGDGLVITAINGRTETRSYAKGIKRGASEVVLSPEEQQAVRYAVKSGQASGRATLGEPGEHLPMDDDELDDSGDVVVSVGPARQ